MLRDVFTTMLMVVLYAALGSGLCLVVLLVFGIMLEGGGADVLNEWWALCVNVTLIGAGAGAGVGALRGLFRSR